MITVPQSSATKLLPHTSIPFKHATSVSHVKKFMHINCMFISLVFRSYTPFYAVSASGWHGWQPSSRTIVSTYLGCPRRLASSAEGAPIRHGGGGRHACSVPGQPPCPIPGRSPGPSETVWCCPLLLTLWLPAPLFRYHRGG